MADLSPTHSCFDDALAFFLERDLWKPSKVGANFNVVDDDRALDHLRLVHGICRREQAPERYVHAWVEDKHPDNRTPLVWQGAIVQQREPIWFAATYDSFYAGYRVETRIRYTYEKAKAACQLSGHNGPWRPDYRALMIEQESQQPDASRLPVQRMLGVDIVKVRPRKIIL